MLAEAAEESGNDPSRAIALLEQLLTRYPDDEEAYDAIIHAYTHTHDPAYWKKSLPIMERWARAIPGAGSGHFHNHYGYAYIEHGLFTEAEREFRAYIRVSPDEANAYDSLAELYLATGRPSLAIENYSQALRLNPQFGWSHFGRAYAHAVEGRYTAAIAELTMLQNLGARGGVPGVAIKMLDALLAARVGRHGDAGRHLDEARRLAGQLKDSSAEADADLFDAMLALERGDSARAILYSGRAARVGTDAPVEIMRIRRSAFALLIAGIADARRDRREEARAHLEAERTLNVTGDDIQSSWLQGLTGEIALAERRFDDAEQAFRAAEYPIASSFAIYPALVVLANNPPFRDGLARTAMARGDLVRARQLYERLNRPDATSTWEAIFEPRYTRAARQLATRLQPSVQPALARP